MTDARSFTVRPLVADDEAQWTPLWDIYLHYYRSTLPPEVTAATFARLCEGNDMAGLIAVDGDGTGLGVTHVVFHPSTWSPTVYCYLEDLVVAPAARGRGIGAALIQAVYDLADTRGATRVYWHTQEYNAPARALYDEVAHRTSFVKYQR